MSANQIIAVTVITSMTLAAMVMLLMREGTGFGHLIATGGIGGAVAGLCWRGRRGLIWGLIFGGLLGLISPCLYAPFWLVFTLPPHPEVDL